MAWQPVDRRTCSWLAAVLLTSLTAGVALAQEELDDLLQGFEDNEVIAETTMRDEPSFWEVTGGLRVSTSYAFAHDSSEPMRSEYGGLAALRAQLALRLDLSLPGQWNARVAGRGFYDFAYGIQGRGRFTNGALDQHEDELEFQEVWLQGSLLPELDLKFGRQIVSWGRSETIRILDVLNPLDTREPGLVDIEDLRLPVTMTRLDYYRGPWILTGVAVHETRFDEQPVFGSEFFPFEVPLAGEDVPGNGGSDTAWAASVAGIFSGWDLSLHWARFFHDRPHLELASSRAVLRHSRLTMWGASGNLAHGNWLLKAEAAHFDGVEFFTSSGTVEAKSRFDLLAGFEYAGFRDATLALEVANRHVSGFESDHAAGLNLSQPNSLETAFRYSADFMNSRLHLTYLAVIFGLTADDGGFMRLSLDYELRDALSLGCGVVLYKAGDLPTFEGIRRNDRLFFTAKYSF